MDLKIAVSSELPVFPAAVAVVVACVVLDLLVLVLVVLELLLLPVLAVAVVPRRVVAMFNSIATEQSQSHNLTKGKS